tara:strand:+ start:572 stop:814 length:243 start_codon:yes stop_codon:yes gene_type:complete
LKTKNLKSQRNRFDLEDLISRAWSTKEDIDLFVEMYSDGETPMTEDEVANIMIGLSHIHNMRMQQLEDCVKQLVEQGKLK